MRTFAVGAALVVVLLALTTAGAARGTPTRDALVRPGVGIGELRLGMTLKESLRALGRPVDFEWARVFPRGGLRYMRYRTRDRLWQIAVFGIRGRERLALIRTQAPRERTREGVGVGTLVTAVPVRLRAQRPVCVKRYPFFKHIQHTDLYVAACAVRTASIDGAATTVFSGSPSCAVPVVRYQGCQSIRYHVASVFMESQELIRHGLSWWYPVVVEPEPPRSG